jgi:hypothetical protein
MPAEKSLIKIIAYTQRHKIEGELLLLKGERLSDKLNLTERQFEPIVNAKVYSLDNGKLEHETPTLALNKTLITLMIQNSQTK